MEIQQLPELLEGKETHSVFLIIIILIIIILHIQMNNLNSKPLSSANSFRE